MGIEQHEDFWENEGTDWETTKSVNPSLDRQIFPHTDSSIWIFEWMMVNCM